MSPIISIVVPVYNVEQSLRRCIESIQRQSIQNIEIILINDGSTDNSLAICKEYQKNDSRIVVADQENRGVSSARNKGLELAKGEYIGFVDPDDWIEPDMYESLLDQIIRTDADVCLCNYYKEPLGSTNQDLNLIEQNLLVDQEIVHYLVANMIGSPSLNEQYHTIMVSVWRLLVRKNILIQNNVRFEAGIPLMEDFLFVIHFLLKSNKVTLHRTALYHYVNNSGSAINKYRDNLNDILKQVYHTLEDLLLKEQVYTFVEPRMDILYIKMRIAAILNEMHIGNHHGLPGKIKRIRDICRDDKLNEVLKELDTKGYPLRRKWTLKALQHEYYVLLYAYYRLFTKIRK